MSRAVGTIRKSIYVLYLSEWFSVFPRKQFLLYRFEDNIRNETKIIYNKIFPFLELPPVNSRIRNKDENRRGVTKVQSKRGINSAGQPINKKFKEKMWPETEAILKEFYKPYNIQLAALLEDVAYEWKT